MGSEHIQNMNYCMIICVDQRMTCLRNWVFQRDKTASPPVEALNVRMARNSFFRGGPTTSTCPRSFNAASNAACPSDQPSNKT